jgi:hypothetical protein
MPDRTYPNLGAVKPHVRTAALEAGNRFNIVTIHGIGARTGISDHPTGYALDYMVALRSPVGDELCDYLRTNWRRFNLKYIIWKQRIDEGNGWKPMEDRGSNTANHNDHVHASFLPVGAGSTYAGDTPRDTPASGEGTAEAITIYPWSGVFTADTWIRVLMFAAGVAALAFMVWRFINA